MVKNASKGSLLTLAKGLTSLEISCGLLHPKSGHARDLVRRLNGQSFRNEYPDFKASLNLDVPASVPPTVTVVYKHDGKKEKLPFTLEEKELVRLIKLEILYEQDKHILHDLLDTTKNAPWYRFD
jgi:hypothetical protein